MKEERKYVTTKAECQKRIDEVGNVCDRCGRKFVPIRTVDNAGNPTYWAGCMHGRDAGHFTAGVPKEIYNLAYKLVLDGERCLCYLPNPKTKEEKQYWFEEQVKEISRLLMRAEYFKRNKKKKPIYTKREFFSKVLG